MRISTHTIYRQGVKPINSHLSNLAKVQEQISSGLKILKPSDDPTSSARLMELHKQLKLNEQYGRNITIANGRQGIEETTIAEVSNILQRARELTIQANNAALTSENRQAIALEVRQLREQLLDTANIRDADGAFLFAGFKEQTQPFSNTAGGDVVYNGDQGQRSLQIGPSRQIASSDAGDDVFMFIRNGNGEFRTDLIADNTGNGTITVGSVTDPATFQSNFMGGNYPYTIQFTVTASPPNTDPTDPHPPSPVRTFDIVDSTGAPVLASQPYTEGETIAFNGIEVAIEGEPGDGDRFIVKPAENQSIFKTLNNLIDVLGNSDRTAAGVAVLTQGLDNALVDIDQGMLHLNQVRGRVGSRMNALDAQDEVNQTFDVQLQKLQSDIGSVDVAEAASRLSEELLALQASQQSFVRIQNLSLFNYLQ
ncbi:MAG: flagellar hook-associated protein FlgL [Gammaproteobacteria bacterium]|nr:flagellar hook-associated protein FlgL [Gammaproteobacteria bacterium]MCP5195461.1 flagellar hook-associated protein FlgL [Gammaproteobacteria bacterium]